MSMSNVASYIDIHYVYMLKNLFIFLFSLSLDFSYTNAILSEVKQKMSLSSLN